MALENMITHIQEEVQKEIDDKVNKTNIDMTHALIALGEELDQTQKEKLHFITTQLQKKEEMLHAEQDFLIMRQTLSEENKFSKNLLIKIQEYLLEYVQNKSQEYQKILTDWLTATQQTIQDTNIIITTNPKDESLIKTVLSNFSFNCQFKSLPTIKAGFYLEGESGVIVDLTFDTLFKEKTQQLLNISMRILKENL